MNWIIENWGMISAITTPVLMLVIGFALKKVPKKYRSDALKVVQAIEKEMIKANYCGDANLIHNDEVKENMDKMKIELGLGK